MSSVSDKESFDVVVVGAGVMGCSVAYHLLRGDPTLRLALVEKDSSYVAASSTLSVGNVRTQFGLEENVRISQHTLEVLRTFGEEMEVDGSGPDVRFRPEGNLMLVDRAGEEPARAAVAQQRLLGCEVDWLTVEEIAQAFPFLALDNLVGATFGRDDGHLDGHNFLMGYRAKAVDLGARIIEGQVVSLSRAGSSLTRSRIAGARLESGNLLQSGVVVNCAGAWAANLTRTIDLELPVQPVERQVFVVESAWVPKSVMPLVTLPSGLYFRSEGSNRILVGRSFDDDRVGFGATWTESRFNELLWPELAEAVPAFDRLRFSRGWAGLYAVNTLDGNAILGEWPGVDGLYLANGFSGHGLQQAPAVGRYLAELILGEPHALDLSIFGPERVVEGNPLSEHWLI